MSIVTFETTKEFLKFQVRLVQEHFIRYMHLKIYSYPWLFTFPKELTEELKEKSAVSPQPAEQKLLPIGRQDR